MGLRYGLVSAAVLALVAAALFLWSRADAFLAENERFRLAEPSSQNGESPALRIEGVVYTRRAKIVETFAADYGRSLYLMPLAERRRSLMAIDWVKDATVSRLWPDRLAVRIVERKPVAFVQLPGASASQPGEVALIDAEGAILVQPERARFTLPVLTGIRRDQSPAMRRERVQTALRLVEDLSDLAGRISEIDVSDPVNLKIVQPAEGRVVMLMLGDRNFRSRLHNFLRHYPEILKRLPGAVNFDLRLDNRITALGEDRRGG
ncbi:MAG: cell division protein FtsQ/DivIB [Bryobacteraceae bacterium]